MPVARTARYFQLGTLSEQTRQVWFVCHGYGQLAEYFIRHFAHLTDADSALVVVAPEALSRFYLQGTSGRIGATWMTREDRLTEIEDYVAYLNQLAAAVLTQVAPDVRVTVLGFSQGAATVSRWLAHTPFGPAHLILWAGVFPPDMEAGAAADLLRHQRLTLVCGDEDEFIKPTDLAYQQEKLQQLGAAPEVVWFPGKHTLHAGVLRQLHGGLGH